MDLFFAFLSFGVTTGGLLIGIGLYWHFHRIGKAWIARIFWVLLLADASAAFGPAVLAGAIQPDAMGILVSAVATALIGAVLTAPLWNPLPPRSYNFDPDEPDDGTPFKIPDEV